MKYTATFKFIIIAAMAAIPVLASCSKEVASRAEVSSGNAVRTVTASFGDFTKTSLEGLQPKFRTGDLIMVANGINAPEDCKIWVDSEGRATFSTTLEGPLTAVYPPTAAVLDGNAIRTDIVNVAGTQTGKFADANICMATEVGDVALFKNKTALFVVSPPAEAGDADIRIRSLNTIDAGTGRRSETDNAAFINTTGTDDAVRRTVTATGKDSDGKVYVSLYVPSSGTAANLTDLSFEYATDASHGAMKGIPESRLSGKSNAIAVRTYYTVDDKNWHEYVEIGGLKWARTNVGANSETEAGYFLAWGATAAKSPYNWANAPFNGGNTSYNAASFANAKSTEFPDGILALKNDAAHVNWGGPWRMATGGAEGEFKELVNATNFTADNTKKGAWFTDKNNSSNKLFLPAAGFYLDSTSGYVGIGGRYRTSTLISDGPQACRFYFGTDNTTFPEGGDGSGGTDCFYGMSVRPVAD